MKSVRQAPPTMCLWPLLVVAAVAASEERAQLPAPASAITVQSLLDQARETLDGYNWVGDPEEALQAADRALSRARQTGDQAGQATALQIRAWSLLKRQRKHDQESIVRAIDEAESIWLRIGNRSGQIRALAERIRFICWQMQTAPSQQVASTETANAAAPRPPQTEHVKVSSLLRRAIDLAQSESESASELGSALGEVGQVLLEYRRFDEARQAFATALLLATRRGGVSLDTAAALMDFGDLDIRRGGAHLASARDSYQKALEIRQTLAPDSLLVADSLSALGGVAQMRATEFRLGAPVSALLDQGSLRVWSNDSSNSDEIQAYHRAALAIRERLAPDSRLVAHTLEALAPHESDYNIRRQRLERVLSIYERLGPNCRGVFQTLSPLLNTATRQGDRDAITAYQRKRVVAATANIHSTTTYAVSALDVLAEDASERGDLAGARQYYEEAQAEAEHFMSPPGRQLRFEHLGQVARRQGDLGAARGYLLRAMSENQALYPNSLAVATNLQWLALVSEDQGDLDGAREYRQRAATIRQAIASRARDYYQQRLADNRPNTAPATTIGALKALGRVAWDQGHLQAATSHFEKALGIEIATVPASLGVADSLKALGALARQSGDLSGAADYYRRALTIFQDLNAGSPEWLDTVDSLGDVTGALGDRDAARIYYEKALAVRERISPTSPDVAVTLNRLGGLALRRHDLDVARDFFTRALDIQQRLAPNSLGMAVSLREFGALAFEQGNLEQALDMTTRAWGIVQAQAGAVTGEEARQAFGFKYSAMASDLIRVQLASGRTDEAFVTLEEGRAQALLQILTERGVVRRFAPSEAWQRYELAQTATNHAGTVLEATEQAANKAQIALDAELLQQSPQSVVGEYRRILTELTQSTIQARQTYTLARVQSELRWADLRESLKVLIPRPTAVAEARLALPPDAVLAAFAVREDGSTLFLVDRGGPVRAFPLAVSSSELAARVDLVRRETSRDSGTRGVKSLASDDVRVRAARVLYQKLFPPDAQAVILKTKRLLLGPDGVLWDLPFAALVMNERGEPQYLGLEKALTYAQSLSTFAQSLRSPSWSTTAGQRALVVGNPLYDNALRSRPGPRRGDSKSMVDAATSSRALTGEAALLSRDGELPQPLPHAEDEARRVAAVYGVRGFTGATPTETWFRERAVNARIIHLATHGYFNPLRPGGSGILLAVPERIVQGDTSNDGALQAWEVFTQLHLRADLVVLSACETGAGAQVPGEGLIGLTRAFQAAGALSVVATKWRVPDQSTAIAMVAFHQHLKARAPKDEALRLSMRRLAADPKTAHPYYWAPFVLFGAFN